MNEFASELLWHEIGKLAKRRGPKHAAIAYVASDTHVAFGRGDVLVTDASNALIAGGQTSAKVLSAAYKRGAKLYSLRGLHAKVICFDRHVAVGSANVSTSSERDLVEAGVILDDPRLLAEARAFIEQLTEKATPIDKAFLRDIVAIPVVRTPRDRAPKLKLKDSRSRVWLVSLSERDDPHEERDAPLLKRAAKTAKARKTKSDSTVSPIWYVGGSAFRREAKRGDVVIQIWSEAASKKLRVWEAAPILTRDDADGITYFSLEEPRGSGRSAIPWPEFVKHWKSLIGSSSPSKDGARCLRGNTADRILALWKR